MSRWFRHYAGLCRDEKLVSVAIKAKQPVERVVWIWAAILESAAEIDDDGRYALDCAEVAYFLRADEADIHAVSAALEAAGRVAKDRVVKWGNRQFSSDRSKERVAAHRERKRSEGVRSDVSADEGNGGVTLQPRHCNSPETETETEVQLATANCRAEPAPKPKPAVSLVDQLWTDGVLSLEAMHVVPPKARSMVGKWLKDTGSDAGRVLWAINEAQIHGSGDPIPYIARVLSDRATDPRPPPHRQARRNTGLDGLDELERRFAAHDRTPPTLRIAG